MTDAIHQQFTAAIRALEKAIRAFPEDGWTAGEQWHQPWYLAYHGTFWLDYYLSEAALDYAPPPPFTSSETEAGSFPERPYAQTELLSWLGQCHHTLAARLSTIATPEGAQRRCRLPWGEMAADELLLYNLRHVQHHAAQLNLLIRRKGGEPARWVMRADWPA